MPPQGTHWSLPTAPGRSRRIPWPCRSSPRSTALASAASPTPSPCCRRCAWTRIASVDKRESGDLLPGAGGAVYGSDALGGVVELNTHKNLLTQRSATFMLTARSATPGDENSAMGRLRFTSPSLGAEVSAGAGGLDALVTPDGRVPNSSYHEYEVSGRVSARL